MAGAVTKIVGGQSVGSLEFPWYVALVSPTGSSTLQVSCGGSLITSRHVLSAAHCFPRSSGVQPEQLYRAVLGLVNRCSQQHPDMVTIARVRVHPEYNPQTQQADVSVITLARTVSYTPVCLPPRNYQPYGPAVVIGFGSTLAKSQYPCTLMQAQVDIYSRRQCARSSLAPEYSHVPGTICAGVPAGGVDSCDGDSGGPIMTVGKDGAYIVQGIVSFGEGCARKNLPGVYTKVSAYREFIDSSVNSGGSDDASGDGSSTSRPLSAWEYFLLQLFNPNHRRRTRPSHQRVLGAQ
ncbi:trypsin-like isoform X3 [Macrosteles quadrilineatus]|uniref:trypsin-like isoform X3 n=1 Tax=Macrosteles quadrilineatus TaxID=74068 RepID=UPI0023E21087|nr:trypsin-like isoform X3 [Macrosteles quadrilineatus]